MTDLDLDEELAQLRADVVEPDAEATRRIAARLARSIGPFGGDSAAPAPRGLPWARPLQLATSFVVGGVMGAGLYGALRAPRVERVYVERSPATIQTTSSSATPLLDPVSAPSAVVAVPTIAEPPPRSNRSTVSTPSASASGDRLASLAEQQALLDVARAAFARSDYSGALQTLATHAARFPKSVLAEEREALQIKALAASDRLQEARALATRFQARHPQSLLLPSIKDSVGTIP
ncbi:MAG TPA: hypothetical protein VER96_05630 [Polyangiaceae bacterium]|nr:hypothetical protein [Polyangiaceae bacterium]